MPQSQGDSKPVIVGAVVVLLAGGIGILTYKGYFRGTKDGLKKDETRFTQFAKQAEQAGWQSEAPTALADSVRGRIDRDAAQYSDKRFADLKTRFQSLESQHKQGKQSNTEYQAALIALNGAVDELEFELDPEKGPPRGKGPRANNEGQPGEKSPENGERRKRRQRPAP